MQMLLPNPCILKDADPPLGLNRKLCALCSNVLQVGKVADQPYKPRGHIILTGYGAASGCAPLVHDPHAVQHAEDHHVIGWAQPHLFLFDRLLILFQLNVSQFETLILTAIHTLINATINAVQQCLQAGR